MTASTLLHVLIFGLIVYLQPYLPVLSQVDAEPAVTMVEIADKEIPAGDKEKEPVVKESATEQEPAADSATSEEGEGAEAAEDEVSSDAAVTDGEETEGEGDETGPDQSAGDSGQLPVAEEPPPPPVPESEGRASSPAGTEETEPLGGGAEDASETPSGTEPTPEAGLLGGGTEPLEGGAPLANDVSVYGTALTETVTIPDGEDVRVVPGVGEGIPATLDDDRYDWKGYIQSMLVLLDRAITPRLPSEIDPRTDDPIVSVVVMRDGSVRSVKMVRSSGVQAIDDAVLAGLTTRMPRLPDKWPARAARIPLLFRLPRR